MYTEKLDASELPTELQILIPEDVEYICVDFEYEPAEEGNRSGHPDTWSPDEGELFVIYNLLLDNNEGLSVELGEESWTKIHDMCIRQLMEKYSEY